METPYRMKSGSIANGYRYQILRHNDQMWEVEYWHISKPHEISSFIEIDWSHALFRLLLIKDELKTK